MKTKLRFTNLFYWGLIVVSICCFLRSIPVCASEDASRDAHDNPHQLILDSYVAGVFNNLGAMYSMSLKHRIRLYESEKGAFAHNGFQYGLTQEVTPSNSVTSLSTLLAPTSFFNLELKYSLAAEWFYIHIDDVNEDYEMSSITDRLDDQSDRTEIGHGFATAPTLQIQFPLPGKGGIRIKNTGTIHWWRFPREVYYNYITDMLYDRGWNYRNQAYLLYFRPIGKHGEVEWMVGLAHDYLYTSGNGRSRNKLTAMTIFKGLPFFGDASAYALVQVGAWLHNNYQDHSLIPGTPITALLVYGFEANLLK